MHSFEQHCENSVRLFNEPFKQVHAFLDEFARQRGIGVRHRKFRHHEAGIEEVRRRWGDKAAEAARAHIIADLRMDLWAEGYMPIPKDEQDYVAMGLY